MMINKTFYKCMDCVADISTMARKGKSVSRINVYLCEDKLNSLNNIRF